VAKRERRVSGIGVRGFGWSPSSAENLSLAGSLEILKPRSPLVQDWDSSNFTGSFSGGMKKDPEVCMQTPQ